LQLTNFRFGIAVNLDSRRLQKCGAPHPAATNSHYMSTEIDKESKQRFNICVRDARFFERSFQFEEVMKETKDIPRKLNLRADLPGVEVFRRSQRDSPAREDHKEDC
jgi:hypothetical protein